MLSVEDCFKTQKNSMAKHLKLTWESEYHEGLQREEKTMRPYAIFDWHGEDAHGNEVAKVPKCLTRFDGLASLDEIR
jgi:hypothetical protein